MHENGRRRRVEPTDEWEQLELLCGWLEQRDYELIRPLVLFGSPASARAAETGAASERTLQRRVLRFDAEGMESLFGSEAARRKALPPSVRRLVVDLKAAHPGFNPNEIANVCYVRFGRRPARKTVKRVLAEEPVPLRFVRRFPPYHDIGEPAERRRALVALHAEGWIAKAISGYLRMHHATVHRVLRRWVEEGVEGLDDRPHGRPPGVRRVDMEALVTDGGGIFRARQARAVYGALRIRKEEIERGRPWQSYIETHFNVQRRMAGYRFAEAERWAELAGAHDRFVEDYNAQPHWAHREREDGRRSPSEVLGFLSGVRHREEGLRRAFFSSRFARTLDSLGYARFRHWRLYGEEALAGLEAALWLAAESLTLEHEGEPLSRYEVKVEADTGELRSVGRPRLFETSTPNPQPRLFGLDALGETGWLKALRLEGYAPRRPQGPLALQQALFPYAEAL